MEKNARIAFATYFLGSIAFCFSSGIASIAEAQEFNVTIEGVVSVEVRDEEVIATTENFLGSRPFLLSDFVTTDERFVLSGTVSAESIRETGNGASVFSGGIPASAEDFGSVDGIDERSEFRLAFSGGFETLAAVILFLDAVDAPGLDAVQTFDVLVTPEEGAGTFFRLNDLSSVGFRGDAFPLGELSPTLEQASQARFSSGITYLRSVNQPSAISFPLSPPLEAVFLFANSLDITPVLVPEPSALYLVTLASFLTLRRKKV